MEKEQSFKKGLAIGIVIGILIMAPLFGFFYYKLSSENTKLQNDNEYLHQEYAKLKLEFQKLQNKYNSLSSNYNSLVVDYKDLNKSYVQEVQQYDTLLANYKNVTDYGDEKFIVLLFFTTNYGDNKYWLYLEIDPQVYFHYKEMPHIAGSFQNLYKFKRYVVVDNITKEIVNAVKSHLVSHSYEELEDALLSVVQDKLNQGYNGEIYQNLDHVPGDYYYEDSLAKYPVETLVLRSGDSLDNTIFYLSLLKTAGFKGGFLFIPPQSSMPNGHVMAVTNLPSGDPTHVRPYAYIWKTQINGTYYYPAETVLYDWRVGESPYDLVSLENTIVLLD